MQWVDHILHYCTVPAIQHLRNRIQGHCDDWSWSIDIDVRVQSVYEVLQCAGVPASSRRAPILDLRGFLLNTVRRQGGEFDFLPDHLAALFTKFNSKLIQLDRPAVSALPSTRIIS